MEYLGGQCCHLLRQERLRDRSCAKFITFEIFIRYPCVREAVAYMSPKCMRNVRGRICTFRNYPHTRHLKLPSQGRDPLGKECPGLNPGCPGIYRSGRNKGVDKAFAQESGRKSRKLEKCFSKWSPVWKALCLSASCVAYGKLLHLSLSQLNFLVSKM